MSVTIVGLEEVKKTIANIALLADSEDAARALWLGGGVIREHCQQAANALIYFTPESKSYRRTGYLKTAIYLTMLGRTDRAERQAMAYAMAVAVYPNRSSNPSTYKMVHHTPYTTKRAIRITSGARYSDYVEFGGGAGANGAARPFMRNGSDEGERDAFLVMERVLRQAIRRIKNARPRNARGQFMPMGS